MILQRRVEVILCCNTLTATSGRQKDDCNWFRKDYFAHLTGTSVDMTGHKIPLGF